MGNCGGSEKPPESRIMRMHTERLKIEREEREMGMQPQGGSSMRSEQGRSMTQLRRNTMSHTNRRRSSYAVGGGNSMRGRSQSCQDGASVTSASSFRSRRQSRGGYDRDDRLDDTQTLHIQEGDEPMIIASPGNRSAMSSYDRPSQSNNDFRSPQSGYGDYPAKLGDRSPLSLKSSVKSSSMRASPQGKGHVDRKASFSSQPDIHPDNESVETDLAKANCTCNSIVRFVNLAEEGGSEQGSGEGDTASSPKASPHNSPGGSSCRPPSKRPVSPILHPTAMVHSNGRVSPMSGRGSPSPGGGSLAELHHNNSFRRSGSFDANASLRRRGSTSSVMSSSNRRMSMGGRRSSRVNL